MHHHAGDLLDDRKALQERSWPVLLDEACRRFVQWLAVLQDELLHESFGHPRIVSNRAARRHVRWHPFDLDDPRSGTYRWLTGEC